MNLEKTIKLMQSDDYKDRFLAEYWQLRIRKYKLHKMLVKYKEGTLNFEPSCPYSVLRSQYEYMDEYLTILEQRALAEEIDLYGYDDN